MQSERARRRQGGDRRECSQGGNTKDGSVGTKDDNNNGRKEDNDNQVVDAE